VQLGRSTQVGPVIDANAIIRGYIEKGRSVATVALEMPAPDTGYFIGPVIFSEYPLLPLLKKKFWPSCGSATGFQEAIAVANNTNYALTGGLYSRTPTHIQVAQSSLWATCILIQSQVRSYQATFGGFKLSGVGSKAGPDYLLQF